MLIARLARFGAVQQVPPYLPEWLITVKERGIAHGAGDAGLQIGPKRGQRKGAGLSLGQEINSGEQAQDAVQRGRMRARSLRQVLAAARAVFQEIRDPEFELRRRYTGSTWKP